MKQTEEQQAARLCSKYKSRGLSPVTDCNVQYVNQPLTHLQQ